jgi:hypothetical protein
MNPITDIIFTLTWFLLLIWAIRTMATGWGLSKPVERSQSPSGMWTTQVKKPMHPEMVDVKPGEELMGVTFKQKDEDSLYKSLGKRIEQLEEDGDDDDGDIVVRL